MQYKLLTYLLAYLLWLLWRVECIGDKAGTKCNPESQHEHQQVMVYVLYELYTCFV